MVEKRTRRSSRQKHYRQATPAVSGVTQAADEREVRNLLSGGMAKEAASALKWPSGKKQTAHANNINWMAAAWLVVIHLGALAAPWTFTWSGLLLVVVLHWLCGGIGICLGYHRMLTHGSFATFRWMRRLIASIGCLAGEGPPLMWVANHRLHHARSDQEGDPHSPHEGAWWSHAFWLAFKVGGKNPQEYYRRWAPDLYQDRFMRHLDWSFVPLNIVLGLAITGAGYAIGGWPLALSWLVWGVFVRMVFVLHSTWFVNSASHMWGYRNYETRDDSRNNWWVALLTYGEGWHNNHHAHPRMAKHGHQWWEFDITFWTIRLMQRLGLVWDVVDYRKRSEQESRAA